MMWFCGLLQNAAFNTYWIGLQPIECEMAGMRVSTSKSEAMVLCSKAMDCSLQVGSELLPKVKEF